jgi:IgGFc binding protein
MNRSGLSVSLSGLLCAIAAGAIPTVACSTREPFQDRVPPPPFDTSDAATPEQPPCGLHCSRDLKQVLDGCEGAETVVEQCNADQGCGDGKCVDACTAAVLTKGSAGCDFWTVPPNNRVDEHGGCFAAMIANTWDRAVTISKATYTVEQVNREPVYTLLEGPLPPGQVAIVFFSHDDTNYDPRATRCPVTVTPAMLTDPARYGTALSRAFHIKTDAPVSAYSIYPYGGADSMVPSATLLLPVSAWTKNYVAVSPYDFGYTRRRRSLHIVASEDGTEVSMLPHVQITAGAGVTGATAGVAQTWTLSKGQALQFLQSASTTGSPIQSNKPVAVFGGSECTELPVAFCDNLLQQVPAFEHWGSEYAAVPFLPRIASFSPNVREKVPYTIVGGADGTTLTYDPARPLNAPETIGAGESVSFITDSLFVVKSQDSKHPFHVNVYMTGANYGGGSGGRTLGDPDFVNVPPTDQYLDRYVFFTDFTFPETSLTLVRRKTANGFMPVKLDCGGEIMNFQPLGSSGQYEFAWVKLTSGFQPQKIATGTCGYGRIEASSEGPFGITVWGVATDASYGYVGGTGLRPINDALPQPVK